MKEKYEEYLKIKEFARKNYLEYLREYAQIIGEFGFFNRDKLSEASQKVFDYMMLEEHMTRELGNGFFMLDNGNVLIVSDGIQECTNILNKE